MDRVDWSPASRALACWINASPDLYLIFNAFDRSVRFELPQLPGCAWRRLIDTSDVEEPCVASLARSLPIGHEACYEVGPRSLVALCLGRPG